jgi:hypothetical protein
MSRMLRKKSKRQSNRALLSEVKREMAKPRSAESTRAVEVNKAGRRAAKRAVLCNVGTRVKAPVSRPR